MDDIIIPFITAFAVVLGKIFYDKLTSANLRYEIDYPYPTEDNLLSPIRIFNPKGKTLHDIKIRIEFNGPIQNITTKTNLADTISYSFENRTMSSKIDRLNEGDFVYYFIKVADINENPINQISVNSDEVKGKEFDREKNNQFFGLLDIMLGVVFGIAIGLLLSSAIVLIYM